MESTNQFNKPLHYMPHDGSGVECLDAIRAALGPEGFKCHLRGCLIKYAWRGPYKESPVGDAKKILEYSKRLLKEELADLEEEFLEEELEQNDTSDLHTQSDTPSGPGTKGSLLDMRI